MKHLFTFFILSAMLFVLANELAAQESKQKIHPALQVVLLNASNTDMIDVYATLKEQYPYNQLIEQTFSLNKKARQKEVVRILREFSEEKQQAVRQYLYDAIDQGLVTKMDILWAANTVVFSGVPQVIYDLAENFDEIAEIRYDPELDESLVIDPTETNPTYFPPSPNENPAPQPGLILINAPAVWAAGDSGKGVLAANHDSGCDWDHPDLVNNLWNNLGEDFDNDGHTVEWTGSAWVFDPGDINGIDDDVNGYVDDFIGWDFASNNNDPNTSATHGTHTAGIVCGDGTNGTQTGVAPKTKIINHQLSGESSSWLAIQYSVAAGVDVITSSWSWKLPSNPDYGMHRQMTDFELAAGVVHTNSTSNNGNNLGSHPIPYNISAPGNCPPSWLHPDQTLIGGLSSVIGVGNVNAGTDIIESSSPYGPAAWEDITVHHPGYPFPIPPVYWDYPYETQPGSIGLLKPDVSAPGDGTVSCNNGGGYSSFSGTSGATPHVCGTVALILGANPNLTPAEVSMIIQTTSVEKGAPGKDPRYGAGRIDAYEAYLLALAMIPVELSSFTASASSNSVSLSWTTATETNNSGFSIERKTPKDERWIEVGFVPGFGTTTEIKNYTYTDEKLAMGTYSYRLRQIDLDGTFEYTNSVEIEVYAPDEFVLAQNYPNPFNPSTTIEFSVPEISNVNISVYSVLGEMVATVVNNRFDAGYHTVDFNAVNLPSGTYIYLIKATGENGVFTESKKMLLLK